MTRRDPDERDLRKEIDDLREEMGAEAEPDFVADEAFPYDSPGDIPRALWEDPAHALFIEMVAGYDPETGEQMAAEAGVPPEVDWPA